MKSGIDYFPLDVTLDEKFELIEAEFGLTGFGVVVKLLQRIYGGQGYYIEWTNEVALLFAKRIGVGGSVVSEIVEASIKRGIFDETIYKKYHVLTSKGIQARYFEAVSRRKSVEVKRAYLLVSVADFAKNVNILYANDNIFGKNADISQQSKVKESKVEKSKVKKSSVTGAQAREDDTGDGDIEDSDLRQESEDNLEAFNRFVKKWDIQTRALRNYSGGKLACIDWDAVSERVGKSDYLQKQKSVSFYIDHADEILDGKYFDYVKPRGSPKSDSRNQGEDEDGYIDPDYDWRKFENIHYD